MNPDDYFQDFATLTTEDTPAEVAAAAREHARLLAEVNAAGAAVRTLRESRATVRQADIEAGADALTSDTPDPGKGNEERLDLDLAAAERRQDVATVALRRAFAVLSDALDRQTPEWREAIAEERAATAEELDAALSAVADICRRLDRLDSRRAFLTTPEARKALAGLRSQRPAQVLVNGTPHNAANLLAALREYGPQTAPVADPHRVVISVPLAEVRGNRWDDSEIRCGEA